MKGLITWTSLKIKNISSTKENIKKMKTSCKPEEKFCKTYLI
jgi:hypothetical protein